MTHDEKRTAAQPEIAPAAMTLQACMRGAFRDLAERDRLCALAERAFATAGADDLPGDTDVMAARPVMTDTSYARCITGRPATRVLVDGRPLARFDTITHRDGSPWRYEGLCRSNTAVLASAGEAPPQRFSLADFGVTVASGTPVDLNAGRIS